MEWRPGSLPETRSGNKRILTVRRRSGLVVYDDCDMVKTVSIDSSGNRRPVAFDDGASLALAIRTFVDTEKKRRPQVEGLTHGARN